MLYTVFVGGMEVNDYLLTLEQANNLAEEWILDGYVDVRVVKTAWLFPWTVYNGLIMNQEII